MIFKKTPSRMPAGYLIYLFILIKGIESGSLRKPSRPEKGRSEGAFPHSFGKTGGKGTLLPGDRRKKGKTIILEGSPAKADVRRPREGAALHSRDGHRQPVPVWFWPNDRMKLGRMTE